MFQKGYGNQTKRLFALILFKINYKRVYMFQQDCFVDIIMR